MLSFTLKIIMIYGGVIYMKNKIKETYEKPLIEIYEFDLFDSIASSGNLGPDLMCNEGMFN